MSAMKHAHAADSQARPVTEVVISSPTPNVKFARGSRCPSKWPWALLLALLPFLAGLAYLAHQNGVAMLQRADVAGLLSGGRAEALEALQALNATLLTLQKDIQGSQKELKDGQGRLERDVQWLKGNLSSLHSAQDFAAKEWKGIKQRVAEVEAKAREVHSQPQAAADHLSLQPAAMVIVEPRAHKDLQYVLENFDANMPLNYDLYIFHGTTKREFVQDAARNVALHRHVVYIALDVDDPINAEWYNEFMKSKEQFWDKIEAEMVLTFQTDSVLCGNSPRTIHDFEHLGYIGCAYDRRAGYDSAIKTWWDPWPFWGNGGVTYHRKSRALECIEKLQIEASFPEDVFYSRCVGDEMGIGRRAESGTHLSEFCITLGPFTTFTARTFAAHKMSDPMEAKTGIDFFLDYCPEARPLLGREVAGT